MRFGLIILLTALAASTLNCAPPNDGNTSQHGTAVQHAQDIPDEWLIDVLSVYKAIDGRTIVVAFALSPSIFPAGNLMIIVVPQQHVDQWVANISPGHKYRFRNPIDLLYSGDNSFIKDGHLTIGFVANATARLQLELAD